MADDKKEMNHDVMRRSAGAGPPGPAPAAHEPIPGERDHTTEPPSGPGIIAGTGYGENVAPEGAPLAEAERREAELEGGGGASQRPKSEAER